MNSNGKDLRANDCMLFDNSPLSSDREMLIEILSYTKDMDDAELLADELLKSHGSLNNVIDSDVKWLISIDGLDEITATFVSLFKDIITALNRQKNNGVKYLKDTDAVKSYAENLLKFRKNERFLAIALNSKGKILAYRFISDGTVNAAHVEPRSLVEFLMVNNSEHVIIAHNHPKSSPTPSQQDLLFTAELIKVLDRLGITLLDHIIVGTSGTLSIRYDIEGIDFGK